MTSLENEIEQRKYAEYAQKNDSGNKKPFFQATPLLIEAALNSAEKRTGSGLSLLEQDQND